MSTDDKKIELQKKKKQMKKNNKIKNHEKLQ